MKKFLTFMSFALLAVVLTMAPEAAMAQDATAAGGDLLASVLGMVSGSLGTLIGLGIALFGLYMWLIQQSSCCMQDPAMTAIRLFRFRMTGPVEA